MSSKHVHICDICGIQANSTVTTSPLSYTTIYRAPKKWSNFDGKDVCSKKCAKEAADKAKELSDIPCCNCCHKDNK